MHVCMHACMHACMYACMHACMRACCMHVRIASDAAPPSTPSQQGQSRHMHRPVTGGACVDVYICMYMIHTYTQTCTARDRAWAVHAYMHTCIPAYMHTCIHAYMHEYIQYTDRQTDRAWALPKRTPTALPVPASTSCWGVAARRPLQAFTLQQLPCICRA